MMKMARKYFKLTIYLCFSLLAGIFHGSDCVTFEDITQELFGSQHGGKLAAFGDFNSDKTTDIFIISENEKEVYILLAPENKLTEDKKAYVKKKFISISGGSNITSVVPSDYNGDSQMDVLVTTVDSDKHITCIVYWGHTSSSDKYDIKFKGYFTFSEKMKQEPLILDYNADMLPDVFGEIENGTRMVWLSSKHNNFTAELLPMPAKLKDVQMRNPHSNAFLDLNKDFSTDLIIADSNLQFELWYNEEGKLKYQEHTTEFPGNVDRKVIGQSTFIDLDGDGNIDHVLPICSDVACTRSSLYVYIDKKWQKLKVDFSHEKEMWGFLPPDMNSGIPIALHVGDYNLDSYPDAVTILYQQEKEVLRQHIVIFENVPCTGPDCVLPRTYSIKHGIGVGSNMKPMLVAFYDIYENGKMDIVTSLKHPDGTTHIHALENKNNVDALFIKVLVLSGLCYADCPNNSPPYGVNYPGPSMEYHTSSESGGAASNYASQLSQSAYYSLQLPYTVFGLGQIPDFIERLKVGIPSSGKTPRAHSWTQIVPNSQMVVVPYPANKPESWKNKLFVTPSRSILITGAVLLGTCGFVAGLIAILHLRERFQDKKEKRQEQQLFHFNAM